MVISIGVGIVSLYALDYLRSQIHKLKHKNGKSGTQSTQLNLEHSNHIEKPVLFIFGVIVLQGCTLS